MLEIVDDQLHCKLVFGVIDANVDGKPVMKKGEHDQDQQKFGQDGERRFNQGQEVGTHVGRVSIHDISPRWGYQSFYFTMPISYCTR